MLSTGACGLGGCSCKKAKAVACLSKAVRTGLLYSSPSNNHHNRYSPPSSRQKAGKGALSSETVCTGCCSLIVWVVLIKVTRTCHRNALQIPLGAAIIHLLLSPSSGTQRLCATLYSGSQCFQRLKLVQMSHCSASFLSLKFVITWKCLSASHSQKHLNKGQLMETRAFLHLFI